MIDTLKMGSIDEMFYRAKYVDLIKFNHFYEWISHDVNMSIYNHDDYFNAVTSNYKQKLMRQRNKKMNKFYS